jgi:V-type H+-transporting ATPase subunit d
LKIISGVKNGKESLEMLYKCHPLGMFETIGAIYYCKDMNDLYNNILIDSPLAQFFTKTDKADFDEYSMGKLKNLMNRTYS